MNEVVFRRSQGCDTVNNLQWFKERSQMHMLHVDVCLGI